MPDLIDLTVDDEPDHTVDLQSEEDEDEKNLQRAIAMSLQDQPWRDGNEQFPSSLPDNGVGPSSVVEDTRTINNIGLAGLNRKAMEAERLSRLKRKRHTGPVDKPCTETGMSPPPLSRRRIADRTISPLKSVAAASTSSADHRAHLHQPSQTYRVLLTSHPSRYSSTGQLEAISFPDILKPPENSEMTLKSALLSSFIADFDWLLPHFQTNKVGFVFVLHAHNEAQKAALQADFAGLPNVRLILPKLAGGRGTMHSKTILLFFEGQGRQVCRIIVPSANLVPYDWGVGGIMENILWTVDLPAKTTQDGLSSSPFRDPLCRQLEAMGVPPDVTRKLDTFDFRAVEECRFIHSCSTSQVVDRPKTGLLSLSTSLESLQLHVSSSSRACPPRIDFVTSSLGNLSQDFVNQLILAVCGRTHDLRSSQGTRNHASQKSPSTVNAQFRSMLHIYFPSADTVRSSHGGPGSGGTICFQKHWWEANELIQDCLLDLVNKRDTGTLMHSKVLYVRYRTPVHVSSHDTECSYAGWAYVGSANCSESAWGRVTNSAKGASKFTCRNWESGVLVPVRTSPTTETVTSASGDSDLLDSGPPRLDAVFRGIVPVPMLTPSVRYKSAGLQPWFFMERA